MAWGVRVIKSSRTKICINSHFAISYMFMINVSIERSPNQMRRRFLPVPLLCTRFRRSRYIDAHRYRPLMRIRMSQKNFRSFWSFLDFRAKLQKRREQICNLTNRSRKLWSLRFISSTKVVASSYISTSAGTLCPLYLRPLKRCSFLYSLFLQHLALASWWHMRPSQEQGCKGKRLCFRETRRSAWTARCSCIKPLARHAEKERERD